MKKAIVHHAYRKKESDTDSVLDWLKMHNLFPILVGLVTLFTAFSSIKEGLAINQDRVQSLQQQVNTAGARIELMQQTIQKDQLDLIKLQNGTGIHPSVLGESVKPNPTISLTPTPTPTEAPAVRRKSL